MFNKQIRLPVVFNVLVDGAVADLHHKTSLEALNFD